MNQHNLDPNIKLVPAEDPEKTAEAAAKEEAERQERIKEALKKGDVETAYKEFSKTWISENELKSTYNIKTTRKSNEIWLTSEDGSIFIIENVPYTITCGKIYASNGVQYQFIDAFKFDGEKKVLYRLITIKSVE